MCIVYSSSDLQPIRVEIHNTKWTKDRQIAWKRIPSDPNQYYLRYLPPNQMHSDWSDSDVRKLKMCLKYHTPNQNQWGLFSFRFDDKTGLDCYQKYVSLMKVALNKAMKRDVERACTWMTVSEFKVGQQGSNTPHLECILKSNASSEIVATATVFLAPRHFRSKYLFVIFKHSNKTSNSNAAKRSMPAPSHLHQCSAEIQNIINTECKALYQKIRNDVANNEVTIKIRQHHDLEAQRLFWRHAFLMAADLNTVNVATPRVDPSLVTRIH